MGRPAGQHGLVRQALRVAALRIASQIGATWRDLAAAACVGLAAAATTVKNMVRAGELVKVGHRRTPGARRPMALYAPAQATPQDHAVSAVACTSLWCPA